MRRSSAGKACPIVPRRRIPRDVCLPLAPHSDAAISRVAKRFAHGGHLIPDDVVRRRYAAGLHNMRHVLLPLADIGMIYDNSGEAPLLIAEKRARAELLVCDVERWQLIEDATREDAHGSSNH